MSSDPVLFDSEQPLIIPVIEAEITVENMTLAKTLVILIFMELMCVVLICVPQKNLCGWLMKDLLGENSHSLIIKKIMFNCQRVQNYLTLAAHKKSAS